MSGFVSIIPWEGRPPDEREPTSSVDRCSSTTTQKGKCLRRQEKSTFQTYTQPPLRFLIRNRWASPHLIQDLHRHSWNTCTSVWDVHDRMSLCPRTRSRCWSGHTPYTYVSYPRVRYQNNHLSYQDTCRHSSGKGQHVDNTLTYKYSISSLY